MTTPFRADRLQHINCFSEMCMGEAHDARLFNTNLRLAKQWGSKLLKLLTFSDFRCKKLLFKTKMSLLGKKTLCVITGASRGIGKAITLKLVSHLGPKSHVILIARDQKALESVKVEALSKATDVSVSVLPLDLSNVSKELYHTALNGAIEKTCTVRFDLALLIQNAATVGPVDLRALQLRNVDLVRDYFDLNVTSFIIFNNVFFALCDEHFAKERMAVNISSGASYASLPSLHLYSAGKAARDAFYRCFAAEETGIRVLNFNPGPVTTDMQMEIYEKTHSTEIKEWSKDGMDNSTFATCEAVAEKFVDCLERNDFESGAFRTVDNHTLVFRFED
ncbi:hypothetical protein M514_06311 [Trichuris suis]|uniref:Sepiapterin reductase n=1 Tax=Trichuris suis TaxID=68888 RepID=A0A085N643_9BILA|nr:hypothetical protein M514_06311 [Trichuris suis]